MSQPTTVATVAHPDSPHVVYDECWTWETGQNYANQGYLVTAVAPDGDYWDIPRQQALYDHERALFIDCWGRDAPFDH